MVGVVGDEQVDLLDFIDWSGVECLNQNSSHSISNALKQVKKETNYSLWKLGLIYPTFALIS